MISIKYRIHIFIIFAVVLLYGCDHAESDFNVAKMDARGTVCITEVHWSGSIDDFGDNDFPDDDFIEIKNYTDAPIDISGWSVHVEGDYSFVISLPQGTIINTFGYYTVGRTRRRAFPNLTFIYDTFKLPNTPFTIKLKDGAGTSSDTADFKGKNYLPGGMYLPLLRKSAIRRIEFFGPEPGDLDYNWMTYNAATSSNISSYYDTTVFASPGGIVSGEGF